MGERGLRFYTISGPRPTPSSVSRRSRSVGSSVDIATAMSAVFASARPNFTRLCGVSPNALISRSAWFFEASLPQRSRTRLAFPVKRAVRVQPCAYVVKAAQRASKLAHNLLVMYRQRAVSGPYRRSGCQLGRNGRRALGQAWGQHFGVCGMRHGQAVAVAGLGGLGTVDPLLWCQVVGANHQQTQGAVRVAITG